MRTATWFRRPAVLAIGLIGLSTLTAPPIRPASAVEILIQYADGADEGFNDPLLGAARRAAFEFALTIWGNTLTGTVPVVVTAAMDPLGGTASSAVLGWAGAALVGRDFTGAPLAGTWYPIALANQMAGTDLAAGTEDIGATFNSDVDNPTVLGSTDWYYGTDGNAGSDIDFVAVLLHELGHGLGFLDMISETTGEWLSGFPDAYGRNLLQAGVGPFLAMSNGQRLAALTSGDVFWNGPNVVAMHGEEAEIYAPSPYATGSSISHWSTSLSPDELMEPFYTSPIHDPGLAVAALEDIGWAVAGAPTTTMTTTSTTSTTTSTTTTLPPVDPFLCYRAKQTKRTTKFSRILGINLTDLFEGTSTDVVQPKTLCNPATLDGSAPFLPDAHFVGYTIAGKPRHVHRKTIRVTNTLGWIVIDTIKPYRLLVPSAQSLVGPPAAADPPAGQLDHFKCYKIKLVKGSPAPHKGTQVTVLDAFTGAKTFSIQKPKLLCNPVDKNFEGIKNAGGHLLCYGAKAGPTQPRHVKRTGVYVANGFGSGQLDTKKEDLLCTPAVVTLF